MDVFFLRLLLGLSIFMICFFDDNFGPFPFDQAHFANGTRFGHVMLYHTHLRGILQLGSTLHISYAACMEYAQQRHVPMTVVPFARSLSGNTPGWPENTLHPRKGRELLDDNAMWYCRFALVIGTTQSFVASYKMGPYDRSKRSYKRCRWHKIDFGFHWVVFTPFFFWAHLGLFNS